MAKYRECEYGACHDFGEVCDCEKEDIFDFWDEVDKEFNERRDEKMFRECYESERI